MVVLGVATVGAAFAPTLEVLIAFRVLQGVAGSVFPLTFGIVREQLPPERIGFGIGVVSAIFGIGSGFGYVISGVVLEVLDTHWLFLLALIPVGLAVALVPRLPESPELAPGRPDWLGGLLLAVGLLALLVGLTEGKEWGWTSPAIVGLFGGGLLVLWLWTRLERRVEHPMVDMAMLRAGRPWRLLNFSTFLVGYAMFAVYTILPELRGRRSRAHRARVRGIAGGDRGVPAPGGARDAGRRAARGRGAADHPDQRPAVRSRRAGALADPDRLAHDERWLLYAGSPCWGSARRVTLAVLGRLAVEAVRSDQTGIAGGINTLMRTVGGAVSAQASAVIIAGFALPDGDLAESGYMIAFSVAAVVGRCRAVCRRSHWLAPGRRARSSFAQYQPTNRLP